MQSLNSRFNTFFLSVFFGFSLLFLFSCNDTPTSLGFPLDTINLEGISSNLVVDAKNYLNRLTNTRNNVYFVVGKGNGMEALSILRFDTQMYDTLDYIQESDIISANFTIGVSRYAFGDSLSAINQEINVYELQKVYTDSTTWDSIAKPNDGKNYYNSNELISSYSGKIALKDSMESLSFDIKKSIIAKWMQNVKDTSSTSAYAPFKNGLVFVAGNNSKMISRFFVPKDNAPLIKVLFNNTKTSKVDTLNLKLATHSYFANTDLNNDKSIVIQGMASIRSQIFFDVSKIPALSSIVKAQLELTLDSSKCLISNYGLDSVLALGEFTDLRVPTPSAPFTSYRRPNSSVYVFPSVTSAIERWNRLDGKGSLILIPQKNALSGNELNFSDRLVFYGIDAVDINKRPKLMIIYSKKPKI